MTPRTVTYLTGAAVLSTAVALYAYRANNVFVPEAGVGEKIVAGLEDKVNTASTITIEKGDKKLELVKKDGVWAATPSGYPLSPDKVKKALVGLSALTKLEAKTAHKDKYILISVDDPGLKDAKGIRMTLADDKSTKLAQIVLGKILPGRAGPGRDAQYVRLAGAKTSWLALGSVTAGTSLTDWVDARFLKLNVDTVTKGRIEHADGEKVEVERTGKTATGSPTFGLLNIPEGRKPRTSTTIKFAATDLVNLDLVDVRKRKTDVKPLTTSFIEMENGLKLRFRYIEEDGKGWVQVDVTDKGKDAKAADAITKRTSAYSFQIAAYKQLAFKRRMKDLLQKQK